MSQGNVKPFRSPEATEDRGEYPQPSLLVC